MNKLDNIKKHFNKTTNKLFGVLKILIFPSYELGEGEHKIFSYIRSHEDEHKSHSSIIYGLDADLIMLSLVHLKYCENIYLYRDPLINNNSKNNNSKNNNSKNNNSKNNLSDIKNENTLFKINDLANEIVNIMTNTLSDDFNKNFNDKNINNKNNNLYIKLINDYIFMCYIRNDFIRIFLR